jgi:hypothetical protein
MSELLPVDDQPTMTTSEPLYPPPVTALEPAPAREALAAAEPAHAEPAYGVPAHAEPAEPAPAEPAVVPTVMAAAVPAAATEVITCPECGTTAMVTLNRREARDFCRQCDYPLFWTASRVLDDRSDPNDQALRRLPGTVGRATVASLTCPHCSEPNAVSAQTCVRCGLPMKIVEAPPPPAPVYVAPPPAPVYVEEPEHGVPWWVWALIAIGLAATITLVVLILTHTIG